MHLLSLAWPQTLRLHASPSFTFTSFPPAQPSLLRGLGPLEASRAWTFVVLRVPGPLYPRVHYKAPQKGRDKGSEVHRIQPGCRARPNSGTAWPHSVSPRGDQQGPCTADLPVSHSRRRRVLVSEHRVTQGASLGTPGSLAVWKHGRRGGVRTGLGTQSLCCSSAWTSSRWASSSFPTQVQKDPRQPLTQQFTCQLPTCQVFAKTKTLKMCSPGSRTLPSPAPVSPGGLAASRAPEGFAFFLCNQILTSFAGLCSVMAFSSVPPEKFVSFCINNKSVEMYFLK